MQKSFVYLAMSVLAGCASASTVQTSRDTAIVQSSAAPACGGIGASKVAAKEAAIATLKAGFDSYVIFNGASESNIAVVQGPGTYNTTAVVSGSMVNATTTYQPGMPMVIGHHGQSFAIKMFHDGDPGSESALSAKAALGPDWQKQMNNPVLTCVG
ncbi:MAG: hypothetical protein EOQ39_24775 [Mesorhizobium sp.]|uniref:hypothetical protein n=1 Tax=unclassified Mesorhizobium TaxID=325217 RepID=UPI000FD3EE9A|nr:MULTISPECIES: hypothetical protein [unclassified Mesorhizobium]AZV19063.1 hypothetical protein EJ079_08080 [Mesorhizobium sp. M7A.F.Ce.TU.012.03.2.1]RVD11570.1 hypothetical protein EN749_29835 [Mesorhizobium sp. M7A.F.Ca.ET.027.02.1.1]RWB02451.1 MAG: hypothetical protein EOQ37_23680 [Mesorhizobium sp.]RWB12103.1 MAG: hypothetical protein EOQ39_24775 [Mesorhizobium sp.]RWD08955.1 MAG: hypothetical protein EOS73_12925 [Mesorhizobium sp.]